MAKITTDLVGNENTATVVARLRSIASYWFGATAATAPTTWGALRTLMNSAATSAMQVSATELGASFITKRNWLNNPDNVVPGVIFAGARQGVWFDPSDFASMFQDTAATVPVTAAGQSVALIRDKSGRGNHASQATASKRPVLTRRPKTGLRNIAWGSASVGDNSYWPDTATMAGITSTKVGSGIDVDGLPYADVRFVGVATGTFTTGPYIVSRSRNPAAIGSTWTASAILRRISGSTTGVSGLRIAIAEETAPSTFVNEASTAPTLATVDTVVSATRTVASGNQIRCAVLLYFTSGETIDVTYRIKGLQLEAGSTRTAYQFNYSLYDLTEPGVQDCYGLMFDGVDDFLQTGNIAWGTDEVTITAGLRKLSDAARGMVAELGPLANQRNFQLNAPTASLGDYGFYSAGTATAGLGTAAAAPNTSVVTGQAKITTDTLILRRNAAQTGTSAADQGAGSAYDTNPLYIGMRAGTSLPFNGILFGLTAVNAVLDATQLGMVERSTNFNTGGF